MKDINTLIEKNLKLGELPKDIPCPRITEKEALALLRLHQSDVIKELYERGS